MNDNSGTKVVTMERRRGCKYGRTKSGRCRKSRR